MGFVRGGSIDLYLDFVREFMFSTDATPGAFGGLSVQDVFTLLDLSFHLQLGKALWQLSLCLSVCLFSLWPISAGLGCMCQQSLEPSKDMVGSGRS